MISIGRPYYLRNPLPLPLYNITFVAPFLADADTRRTGQIFYRHSTDPNLLVRATSEIRAAIPSSDNVTITNLLIVTWDAVGYYSLNIDKVRVCNICMV